MISSSHGAATSRSAKDFADVGERVPGDEPSFDGARAKNPDRIPLRGRPRPLHLVKNEPCNGYPGPADDSAAAVDSGAARVDGAAGVDAAADTRRRGTELDDRLRALSSRSSRFRLLEGWLARDLLARRSWQPLGFVRVSDYTRERLGIGARCLEEEARVAAALPSLPRITSSFLEGTLTWTALRLLVGVATTDDEEQWIAKAAEASTRALREWIGKSPRANAAEPVAEPQNVDEDEDDPDLRWSVGVSHYGRRLWRVACELAERSAGSTLTPAQVLELVAAEAASGMASGTGREMEIDPACQDLLERLRGAAAGRTAADDAGDAGDAGMNAAAAFIAAHAMREDDFAARPGGAADAAKDCGGDADDFDASLGDDADAAKDGGVHAGAPPSEEATPGGNVAAGRRLSDLVADLVRRGGDRPLPFLTEETARDLEDRDPGLAAFYLESILIELGEQGEMNSPEPVTAPPGETRAAIPDPRWFENLLGELAEAEGLPWRPLAEPLDRETASPVEWIEAHMRSLEDADPRAIDACLRKARRGLQSLDFDLAALLREAADRRLYREFGFTNLEQYVESRVGLCPRTAWSLLSVERVVRRCCPLLGEAWREGRLSWLAVRVLAPVVGSRHGAAWIERAQIVTLRRLEAEVAWARDRRDEQNSVEEPAPPPLDFDITATVLAAAATGGLQMRAQFPAARGAADGHAPVAAAEAEADGLQMRAPVGTAEGKADSAADGLQMRAPAGATDSAAAAEADGLQMRAPEPAARTAASAGAAGSAEDNWLPRVQIEFFAPESVVYLAEETMASLRAAFEPRGRAFERMVARVILEWTTVPAHRDPVFARDGWRCAVPGCRSRRNLHDHHIVFRSLGGDNDRDNRITVCAAHHLHGLHRGRIRAHGAAPAGVFWELGCCFGGDDPMARLFGDRYV